MIQRTLVLIKPDGVQRGLVGQIITRFENAGLKIVGGKMVWVDAAFSKQHYAEHIQKKFYPALEAMLTQGPVFALVLEGVEAAALVRKIVGPTEPKAAPPGTIRGDFSHMSYAYADAKDIGLKNIIHASDSPVSAKTEIALWFSPNELHTYKSVHDVHVLE
ncbi:MAG: nucleoside-diphosphate kinase [Candidatus Woesearchaeota archaeon]|nr:nucleoside-diphosphate kinase [Candidatus Woesearchaeota archaeon]